MISSSQVAGQIFNRFIDSYGNSFDLIADFRNRVKPQWRKMFEIQNQEVTPDRELHVNFSKWQKKVLLSENFLQALGFSFKGKKIIEVGDSQGYAAYALSSLGASHVVATDVDCFYENQLSSSKMSAIQSRQMVWQSLGRLSQLAVKQRVGFREDDICNSSLDSECADIIVSWEVLEHLLDPLAAFQNMSRILKPGGVSFHEYNPFPCLTGGHSLCTLDFPWGHIRLSSEDFVKYISLIRPHEKDVALSFYFKNLNRMTTFDLRYFAEKAGFEILSFIPWSHQQHLMLLDPRILREAQQHYPSLTLQDLVSPLVWVVLVKKPSNMTSCVLF